MPLDFAGAAGLVRATLATSVLALGLAAAPVLAQTPAETPAPSDQLPAGEPAQTEEVSPDTVLATIGDETITEGDLTFAAEDLAAELQSIPAAQQRAFLLTVLIDMKVMANAARDEGLADSETFERRLAYLEDRALRRAFFAEMIETAVTDEAVEEAYQQIVEQYPPEPEVRARHILVETEQEANDIRAEIEGGLAFEEAAAQYGTDGTSATGGDLGYFSAGMMVEPFEEAAFALEVGELSQPIQTQFGWHLIKLEDRRLSEAPPLEEVRDQVAQQVLYERFENLVAELKANTEIAIEDEDLAAAVEAQGGI